MFGEGGRADLRRSDVEAWASVAPIPGVPRGSPYDRARVWHGFFVEQRGKFPQVVRDHDLSEAPRDGHDLWPDGCLEIRRVGVVGCLGRRSVERDTELSPPLTPTSSAPSRGPRAPGVGAWRPYSRSQWLLFVTGSSRVATWRALPGGWPAPHLRRWSAGVRARPLSYVGVVTQYRAAVPMNRGIGPSPGVAPGRALATTGPRGASPNRCRTPPC